MSTGHLGYMADPLHTSSCTHQKGFGQLNLHHVTSYHMMSVEFPLWEFWNVGALFTFWRHMREWDWSGI